MGLKEDLQKIVAAERERLTAEDQDRAEHNSKRKKQFEVMNSLIKELADALDPRHGEVEISDDLAVIVLGPCGANNKREEDLKIYINISSSERSEKGYEFNVHEVHYYDGKKYLKFPDEEAVMGCVITRIAKYIAESEQYDQPR